MPKGGLMYGGLMLKEVYWYNMGVICGRIGSGCICGGKGHVPSLVNLAAEAVTLGCMRPSTWRDVEMGGKRPLTWRDVEMLFDGDADSDDECGGRGLPPDLAEPVYHALGRAHFLRNKHPPYRMHYSDAIAWRNGVLKTGKIEKPRSRYGTVVLYLPPDYFRKLPTP